MPEVKITIGQRDFEVACHEGEETFLKSAAKMLDDEASKLLDQIGRMPENRMLLMSGLMLADKTGAFEDQLSAAKAEIETLKKELEESRAQTKTIEVPTIPQEITDSLAQIAARAEALADQA